MFCQVLLVCENTNSLSVLLVLVDPLDVVVGEVPLAVRQEPLQLLPVRQFRQLFLQLKHKAMLNIAFTTI